MLFVVLIPAWAWTALMVAAWSTLALQAHLRVGFGHFAVLGLVATLALQTIAASSAAIVTSQDPISTYACLMGVFGMWVSLVIIAVEAAVLLFLYRLWPENSEGKRRGFGSWVLIWLILSSTSLLAHIRSAALCTV